MTRLDVCIDYILSALECLLSLALVTLGLSLPAVSALQAITSGSVLVATLASAVFVGVVVVYALMLYGIITAAISRVHYLY